MRRILNVDRPLGHALAVAGLAIGLFPAGASAHAGCQTVKLPVALSAGAPATVTAVGQLCRPARHSPRASTVQLLVHGGTYGKSYWDWPQQPYSYVRAALAAGYSTLAVDRLGVGETSRPASVLADFPAASYLLHQWVGALRARGFDRVVSVGHSFGSAYAVDEAAKYHDVDALVLSGYLHTLGPAVPVVVAALAPAMFDPKFAGTIYDPGYLTSIAGMRGVFYWLPGAEPRVVARDELLKEPMSASEFPGFFENVHLPAEVNPSRQVNVPVLLAIGDHDGLFCGVQVTCTSEREIVAYERPFWPATPRLNAAIVPASGHNVNLHRTAPAFFAICNVWIAGNVD